MQPSQPPMIHPMRERSSPLQFMPIQDSRYNETCITIVPCLLSYHEKWYWPHVSNTLAACTFLVVRIICWLRRTGGVKEQGRGTPVATTCNHSIIVSTDEFQVSRKKRLNHIKQFSIFKLHVIFVSASKQICVIWPDGTRDDLQLLQLIQQLTYPDLQVVIELVKWQLQRTFK